MLLEMGEWLELNEEAIYATRPWYVFGEDPTEYQKGVHGGIKATTTYTSKEIRYTQSQDSSYIYAFVLRQPEKGEVIKLEPFKRGKAGEAIQIDSVQLIGSSEKVEWKRNMQGVHINAPGTYENDIAIVYRLAR